MHSSGSVGTFPTRATLPPSKIKADRNVHSVVLGDILFPTWYPSFYPEELVGSRVERLYVCQWCFKYSKELMPFIAHTKLCPSRLAFPPGRLIYTRGNHAIYEVDGEEHQLLTQNLSLFAKLFLDNKSVFYDVSSFKYYLLIHTPPPSSITPTPNPTLNPHPNPTGSASAPPHQIIGFFSKEKMSWDNNNLACILIFPPWQRRGFGKVLMGVSYALSKREGRIGGPEKPLSELGRKGYTRFWQATVARFVLGLRRTGTSTEAALRLTIKEIARGCWLLPEDVIGALKGMGVFDNKMEVRERGEGEGDGGGGGGGWGGGWGGGGEGAGEGGGVVVVSRVKVREWVRDNGVDLDAPVLEEGFVEEDEEDGEREEEEEREEREGTGDDEEL